MKKPLSLSISLSLVLSAFSPQIASAKMITRTAAVGPAAPLNAPLTQLGAGPSLAIPRLTPGLDAPTLGAGFQLPTGPSLKSLASPAQSPAARAASPAADVVTSAAPLLPLPANADLRRTIKAAQADRAAPAKTVFSRTMQALSAKTPEFGKMNAADSRTSADRDFQARIGEETGAPAVSAADASGDVEIIVMSREGSRRHLTQDVYPASLASGMSAKRLERELSNQFGRLGISETFLKAHDASAIGTVAKINAAVIKSPARNSAALMAALDRMGLDAQLGRRFSIPAPMTAEPQARSVGLKETAKIHKADKLQAELKKVLGEPAPPAPPAEAAAANTNSLTKIVKAIGNAFRRMFVGVAVTNPVLPWAILDSFAWVEHPYMKGRFLKSVSNENDGQTHGTHTASTVVGMDIFNYHGRNYNIFPNGRASESDILFKLNMAQKDGALATTHSWGDGSGNPAGAIEKLFTKMSAEGLHHSISAGNSGYYGKNRIGGPAISVHDVNLKINGKVVGKVKRIKAVAASDADKKTARFSSRGPGSRTTSRGEEYKDWPQKPDESGVGVNLIAAAPPGQGSENAELGGPGMSMSGTSMSNPGVFGAFMLLTRGILVLLADQLPKMQQKELTQFAMDLARLSMTQTAEKVAPADEVGDGFIDVWAAYEFAAKTLKENQPAPPRREMTTKEFFALNLVGVAGSITAGILLNAPLWGILGTFVAPVPVLFAYVGLMRLLGQRISWPKVRVDPSVSFAGKTYHARPRDR
jgi:hypothetical protein